MYSYLDLNKDKIKKSVVSKLNMLGYKVSDDTPIRIVQEIVKAIQRDNGLMIDGLIGRKTMPLIGYSSEEIRRMLKLPKCINHTPLYYPYWFLLN